KEKFVSGKWPVELEANGGGANLRLKGVIAPDIDGSHLEYSLAGKHLGGLASWIPVSPKATESYQLSGEVYAQGADIRIRIEPGRIGGMRFTGEAGIRQENGKPVSRLAIDAGVVDPREIEALLPEGDSQANTPKVKKRYAIDVPILPRGIEIFDSDIRLAIDRLETHPVAFTDVAISARFREGFVEGAPIRAVVAGKTLEGSYGVDLRGDVPAIDLDVRSRQVDLGSLLEQLGLFDGLEMTAGQFRLVLRLAGRSAREMMERSEFSATIREGLWRVRDANTGGILTIAIYEGTIAASRDDPMAITLDGNLDKLPLRMVLTTDSLASFGRPKKRLSLDAGIEFPNLRLDLEGIAPLPVRRDNLSLGVSVVGRRLSDVNDFLDVSLPPWGPYRMTGTFGARPSGYYLDALEVAIGSSTLGGKLELLTNRKPPRLDVDLEAGSIQLDDFDTGAWSPLTEEDETETSRNTGPPRSGSGGKDRAMLSPQVMHMLEGQVDIRVNEVLSGLDRLGNGSLEATLENGRFSVDPLMLSVPGGQVDLAFSLKPTSVDVALDARAKIDRFDYGYLARRIDPDSRAAGLISVDVDLQTRGPRLADVMEGAYGHIDFAIWPKDMNAEIFDLWATNLLIAVLPSLDTGDGSKVNCVVALFGIEDGIMRPDSLFIDTTRVQATADGVIDFKNHTINFLAAPQPKRPHLFSAQTPIQVEGKFSDFSYGVSPGSLLGTTIRMVTSPVVVPLKWVFVERAPADGDAACGAAWRDTGSASAETDGK
ncbi:MAG: AsmA-like C-terminal region-containing protein, partial [Pseudomonadota bacterium]|nr:AsmA-like C-terminal region-containing protein [Pseudomonadota bacterium]